MRFIGGVAAGCLVIMLLSSYFNLILYPFIPKIRFVMNIIGCLYLIYLAIKIMQSKPPHTDDKSRGFNTFYFGFIFQFMNPKVILYGITAVSTFVMPISTSHAQLISYSFLLTIVGICANMTWRCSVRCSSICYPDMSARLIYRWDCFCFTAHFLFMPRTDLLATS